LGRARAWLMHHSRFGWTTGITLSVLAGALFCNRFLGEHLFQRSYDLPLWLRPTTPPAGIVLLYIDENSRENLGQSWNRQWDRTLHAQLLERLKAEGSHTVVFDVVFSGDSKTNYSNNTGASGAVEPGPSPGTERLAAAMRSHGRVVIASHLRREGHEGIAEGTSLEAPDEALASAAAGVGLAETLEDSDTVVRALLLALPKTDKGSLPTIAAEGARVERAAAGSVAGSAEQEAPKPGSSWLDYYGPPGTIESHSYYQALGGLPAGYFSNKLVVVGESYPVEVSGARVDTFRSPFPTGRARFPGAEIHATAIANLLERHWLRRPAPLIELALFVLIGSFVGWLLPRLAPLRATGLGLVLMAGLTLAAFALQWHARIWFVWMIPVLVQIPLAILWAILWHTLKAQMESQFLEHSLSLYLSPKTVQTMLRHPELLKPGGAQRRVSILASDITNFSKISSRMDAEDLLQMLNQYYEEAIGCIHDLEGTVVNLIGDAILAVWNAPHGQADHQERALQAALALHTKVVHFNQRLDRLPLGTRLGLHVGEACVGNMGSSSHFDYAVIGQAVNLAFRLESLNKQLGTSILASREFLKGIKSEIATRMIGHFRFKGFDAVFEVHEVLGLSKEVPDEPWRSCYATGVHHFQRCHFPEAERTFRQAIDLRADDGAAQFMLAQTLIMQADKVSNDWAGEIDLDQK
jgi:adenylate cyclase